MEHLPAYEIDHPDWAEYGQSELGIMVVEVDRIVGGSIARSIDYNPNWSNKEESFDFRYDRALAFVKERIYTTSSPFDLGYIHLFKIQDVFYVCNDGHRRVSAAHVLGIKSILADITKLYPENKDLPTAKQKARDFLKLAMNHLGRNENS